MGRFLEWLILRPHYKIVRVKSWRPVWVFGCIQWPCLLVDHKSGCRMTIRPIWNRYQFRDIFRGP